MLVLQMEMSDSVAMITTRVELRCVITQPGPVSVVTASAGNMEKLFALS